MMGAFSIVLAVAIAGLCWLARPADLRWIDIGTLAMEFDLYSSEARKTEAWIADRERRLAELHSSRD